MKIFLYVITPKTDSTTLKRAKTFYVGHALSENGKDMGRTFDFDKSGAKDALYALFPATNDELVWFDTTTAPELKAAIARYNEQWLKKPKVDKKA